MREAVASPRKSAMATGMRLAPAPVISIESWAWARALRQSANRTRKYREILCMSFIFNKFRAILLFKRLVFDFERALEKRSIIRLGQGRGFADGSFDRPIQRGVTTGSL